MTRVRIGFIGAGGIAGRHLRNLLGFSDVEITAVSDPLQDRCDAFAARAGRARVYADWRTMLDDNELDALYICTPPFAHGPPELRAIEQCIPFFVEKPIAADLAMGERIARAVEQAGLVTAVGYHWRYLDTTEEAQALLARNPAKLVLGYWLDCTPPAPWWSRKSLSGGQMVEQTTHIFDLARLLVSDVSEVFAMESQAHVEKSGDDISKVSTVTLRFDSGALGSISSTCLLSWRHRVELQLYCEGMAIELSEFDLLIDIGQGRPVQKAQVDPFIREDRDFLDAVQGKANRIRAPYAEAARTHILASAATRSAAEGQLVRPHNTRS
jgi:predicted dehydrogenase